MMSQAGLHEAYPSRRPDGMTGSPEEPQNVSAEDSPATEQSAQAKKRGANTTANDDDYEAKRRKRLELNRKAAQESRRRKKARIEELQRSVVYLTRDNARLREQNEQLRQALAGEVPADSRLQEYNWMLKMALGEGLKNIGKQQQPGMQQGGMVMGQDGVMQQQQQQQQPQSPPAGMQGGGDAANLSLLANQGLMHLLNGNRNAMFAQQMAQGQMGMQGPGMGMSQDHMMLQFGGMHQPPEYAQQDVSVEQVPQPEQGGHQQDQQQPEHAPEADNSQQE